MQFTKNGDIYMVSRITGSQDNILGVSFSENNSNDIEVIQWHLESDRNKKVLTSDDQVLKHVLFGLKEINRSLDTNYRLSKIYFVPTESAGDGAYELLIGRLIEHYHSGNEFKKSKQSKT